MVDFHSHTFMCEHATGTPDEYIEKAIACGIKVFGFSDHAPLPEDMRAGVTMHRHQTEEYINLIEQKKNEYAGKIEIRLGFEVDFPLMDSFDRKYLTDPRIDYMIGSCHYIGKWSVDHEATVDGYDKRGVDAVYSEYYDMLLGCASSGFFNIIGHFDLTKKFGHRATEDFSDKIRKIAKAAANTNTAVEVNTAGLRKPVKEMYPSEDILKIMFSENVAVTLGSDSHCPEDVGAGFDKALALIKKCGYKKVASFKKRNMTLVEI